MSTGPTWLGSLTPKDRTTARRWLSEGGGEAAFARIAGAYLDGKRPRGRPSKDDIYRPYVLAAAVRWMTDLTLADFGGAAGEASRRLVGKPNFPATAAAVRREIREALETAPAAFWARAEKEAAAGGRVVRRNPMDARRNPVELRGLQIQRRMDSFADPYTRAAEQRAIWTKIFALIDAFPEMPVTQARRLLGDAAETWAAEQAAAGERAENPI